MNIEYVYIVSISVALSPIVSYIGRLVIFGFKSYLDRSKSKQEIELKSNLDHSNQSINSIFDYYLNNLNHFNSRKLEFSEMYWKTFSEFINSLPTPILLCGSIFTDEEIIRGAFKMPNKNGTSFFNMMRDFDDYKHSQELDQFSNKIEAIRPFISDQMYSIFRSSLAIFGRITLLFLEKIPTESETFWKDDKIIKNSLSTVLQTTEIEFIKIQKIGSLKILKLTLEEKAVSAIRNNLLLSDSSDKTVIELVKLKSLYENRIKD